MHVRVEGGLIKVDHWPAFYDPVRYSHSKLDAFGLQLYWVFTVRIEFSVCWCLLYTMAEVEVSECMHGDDDAIKLVDLLCSLTKSEVHPFVKAGTTQQVLLCFDGVDDLPGPS